MEATVKIVIETKRKNARGYYAVKLRVTHNRIRKYYSVMRFLKQDEWNFCESKEAFNRVLKSKKGINKDRRLNYEAIENRAKDIINEMHNFSFEKFEEKFLNKLSNWDYLANAFEEHINALKNESRLGYAISFHSTLTGIKYFCENKPYPKGVQSSDHAHFKKYKKLRFIDITPLWLKKYEQYLQNEGKSTSTIGIHTRNIRVLFNKAIKEHGIKAEYPFDKYKPKTSSNNKRALTIEQLNKIASFETIDGTPEQFAKDMFVFSFLANGMNITDIFRLKYKNIKEDEIEFVRFKTRNKNKEVKVTVSLTESLKKIIMRHGNKAINKDVYVFPVLNGVTDEQDKYRLITQKTKQINKHLKSIARKSGLDLELANSISTYHARHSFATISKNSGLPLAFIMESLGHSSLTTTEKYLSSFSKDIRTKASQELENKISIA